MGNSNLSKRIIDLRESLDLSQAELARRMKLDKSSMNKIESGSRKVSSEELKQLANIFGVTSDYLLGQNNVPKWADDKDISDLKDFMDGNVNMAYGGENLTEEEKEKLQIALEQIFWKRRKNRK